MNVADKSNAVSLDFHVGETTLFSRRLRLATDDRHFLAQGQDIAECDCFARTRAATTGGYFARSHPIAGPLRRLQWSEGIIRYVSTQYTRRYIDLAVPFEVYKSRFSSKSLATIRRKIRKFAEATGGTIRFERFAGVHSAQRFYDLARRVSLKTYQERLLHAGLPADAGFRNELVEQGRRDAYRGYVLFDSDRPVAYLYAPAQGTVLLYEFQGYDPDYAKLSPGTVLFWMALESIFAERKFTCFDFTEGDGPHKEFFATGQQLCADVYFLKASPGNLGLVASHYALSRGSHHCARLLDRLGIKNALKRFIRKTSTR